MKLAVVALVLVVLSSGLVFADETKYTVACNSIIGTSEQIDINNGKKTHCYLGSGESPSENSACRYDKYPNKFRCVKNGGEYEAAECETDYTWDTDIRALSYSLDRCREVCIAGQTILGLLETYYPDCVEPYARVKNIDGELIIGTNGNIGETNTKLYIDDTLLQQQDGNFVTTTTDFFGNVVEDRQLVTDLYKIESFSGQKQLRIVYEQLGSITISVKGIIAPEPFAQCRAIPRSVGCQELPNHRSSATGRYYTKSDCAGSTPLCAVDSPEIGQTKQKENCESIGKESNGKVWCTATSDDPENTGYCALAVTDCLSPFTRALPKIDVSAQVTNIRHDGDFLRLTLVLTERTGKYFITSSTLSYKANEQEYTFLKGSCKSLSNGLSCEFSFNYEGLPDTEGELTYTYEYLPNAHA